MTGTCPVRGVVSLSEIKSQYKMVQLSYQELINRPSAGIQTCPHPAYYMTTVTSTNLIPLGKENETNPTDELTTTGGNPTNSQACHANKPVKSSGNLVPNLVRNLVPNLVQWVGETHNQLINCKPPTGPSCTHNRCIRLKHTTNNYKVKCRYPLPQRNA